jgi:hypothetical protein
MNNPHLLIQFLKTKERKKERSREFLWMLGACVERRVTNGFSFISTDESSWIITKEQEREEWRR